MGTSGFLVQFAGKNLEAMKSQQRASLSCTQQVAAWLYAQSLNATKKRVISIKRAASQPSNNRPMQHIEGLCYQDDWREHAVLCGVPEKAVFAEIQRLAAASGESGPVKMFVQLRRNLVVTAVFDDLTKNVLTQAECELMDGCCPATTRLYSNHQIPNQ